MFHEFFILAKKKFWPKKNKEIVKNTYATFFYFLFLLHQHAQMNTGPHEKSGVKIFFGDPFLTKVTFSKIMRGRKF